MSNYTHQTAPTQIVEAAGIRFAYRRFANRRFGVTIDIPLLFFASLASDSARWITGASVLVDGGSRL
jgi:NAD(P)-dependent dehydrogenase (short-subunit alcohol dehydrogenase family)